MEGVLGTIHEATRVNFHTGLRAACIALAFAFVANVIVNLVVLAFALVLAIALVVFALALPIAFHLALGASAFVVITLALVFHLASPSLHECNAALLCKVGEHIIHPSHIALQAPLEVIAWLALAFAVYAANIPRHRVRACEAVVRFMA